MAEPSGSKGSSGGPPEAFLDGLAALCPALLGALDALERAQRRLHPPALPMLRRALAPVHQRLEQAASAFRTTPRTAEADELANPLLRSADHAALALRLLIESAAPAESIARVLAALSNHCRAQEAVFPLRKVLPAVNRFFLEPGVHERVESLDPELSDDAPFSVGLHNAENDLEQRGGFSLYVPESYDPSEPRPLVVALHGGSGHGRDFLWTWLREARSRRCLLLAPTARASTWSFNGPDVDAKSLQAMVDFVTKRWRVDSERMLLTGLSDGATYALLRGLQSDVPFTALAPVSGVLHPANFANGNLERARARRVYLVHGRLDWMFPIEIARMAHEELRKAGADVTFREIDDLSHTYPREENARILSWLGVDAAA
ncbi:MAG: PHB depolymerase family esterase [Myxococcota bacterium]